MTETREFTHRAFLKAAAGAVAGVAMGAAVAPVLQKELEHQEGITTTDGIFYGLYESSHSTGIKPEEIRPDTDIFFREFILREPEFSMAPADLVRKKGYPGDTFNPEAIVVINPAILEKLASQNTRLMYGDVPFYANPSIGYMLDALTYAGEFCLGSKTLDAYRSFKKKVIAKIARKPATQDVPNPARRKFMQGALLGVTAWSLSPGLHALENMITQSSSPRDGAILRILDRALGMASALHPERTHVYFRNAVMAAKMINVAQVLKTQLGRLPLIGFNVHTGHNGIEDFIQAGHDFCVEVIARYPRVLLNSSIEALGGVENFASSRIIELPTALSAQNLNDKNILDQIKEERIVDTNLVARLS